MNIKASVDQARWPEFTRGSKVVGRDCCGNFAMCIGVQALCGAAEELTDNVMFHTACGRD